MQKKFDIAGDIVPYLNRTMLYNFAWYEFLQKPLIGMGALSYTVKYRTYPHNIFLEILCEWGALTFFIYFIFWVLLVRKLFNCKNKEVMFIFMLFCGSLPSFILSGSLYQDPLHLIIITYMGCTGEYLFKGSS